MSVLYFRVCLCVSAMHINKKTFGASTSHIFDVYEAAIIIAFELVMQIINNNKEFLTSEMFE